MAKIKYERMTLIVPQDDLDVIRKAATLEGLSVRNFIRNAAITQAHLTVVQGNRREA